MGTHREIPLTFSHADKQTAAGPIPPSLPSCGMGCSKSIKILKIIMCLTIHTSCIHTCQKLARIRKLEDKSKGSQET